MRSPRAFAIACLVLAAACSSTTRTLERTPDAAGGTGDPGAGASGASGTDGTGSGGAGASGAGGTNGSGSGGAGTGGTGGVATLGRGGGSGTAGTGTGGTGTAGTGTAGTGTATGGSGGIPIDCPGAQPCSRAVYRIQNPVSGITRMDPYYILNTLAVGPDTALTQQTASSDDARTTGAEVYLFFVLSCPAGREYGVTWEGYADVNSTHEVLVATADRSYVQMSDWPTARVMNVPTDSDVKETVRGLIPDALGNIFVRVQSSGGKLYTDWLAVGSCI